jgi:hypothetical protein
MIVCPICGQDTRVTETRTVDQYVRRRRQCTGATCSGRVTTAEIVIALDDGRNKPLGDVIVMSRRDVEKTLKVICGALADRYGSNAVVAMITAVLPNEATTAKGTNDGNDHGDGIERG